MATVPYEIVVPSRRRVENMPRILRLLPTATVTVDEREADDYAPHVPADRLLLHAPTETLGQVRQWVLDHREAEAVVMIDDDFRAVVAMPGRKPRRIVEPAAILRIVENAVDVAADLGVALFCWSRMPNPLQFCGHAPASLAALASNAWGVVGREFAVDKALNLCESVDLTLQNLLHRRIVWQDRRFYFDCGGVWAGQGGLQGVRTSDGEAAERRRMARRWGPYLELEAAKKGGTTGMSIRVQRQSALGKVS